MIIPAVIRDASNFPIDDIVSSYFSNYKTIMKILMQQPRGGDSGHVAVSVVIVMVTMMEVDSVSRNGSQMMTIVVTEIVVVVMAVE